MFKSILAVVCLIPSYLVAQDGVAPPLVLDKVSFQISAKQWVSTHTALLGVSINATLNNADLVKARSDIMARLNKIAKGEWHLLEFNRSQDSSGLEKLDVVAQARVDQVDLTHIYQQAKAVSAPGAKYTISSVEFKPGMEETQRVLSNVREQLYQQVQQELSRLNSVYPSQNYTVNNLVFINGDAPVVQPRTYQAKEMNTMMFAAAGANIPALSVSNEVSLTAVVELASNRKP